MSRSVSSRLAWAAIGLMSLAPALGPAPARAEDNTVRPEVGKPLQAAQELIRQQKYREALSRIADAEKVGGLTAFESGLVAQLRGSAAQGAGEYATAARAFEAVIASGRLAGPDQLRLIQGVAGLYYQAKDYPKAIVWANRALKEGAAEGQVRPLLIQAYYLTDDFAQAKREALALIRDGEGASETIYQILLNSQLKTDDQAGYAQTLEALLARFPKPEYWAEALRSVKARPGFSQRLALDAGRLGLAVGVVDDAAQTIELVELALQAGLPGEAKAILDKGYATGLLGKGADGARHARLRDLATAKAAEDLKGLPAAEAEARAQTDGTGLVNTGFDLVGHGQARKGADLIAEGLRKGTLKRPDEARLRLGVALLAAGERDKAIAAWKEVQGSDGTADLARLWSLHAKRAAG